MFSFSAATVLPLLVSLVSAQGGSFLTWSPPGPGDVRSPCPGLNALANHGFLPHNGKNLTIPICIDALNRGMNVGADFATVIAGAAILSVPNSPLATSFNLNDINEHNFPIEHDASLSRADFYENNGDNHSFNQTIFDTVLAYYKGMNQTSIPVAAKAKLNRVQTEQARDPKFTYTPQQFILSYGETSLYLSVLGNPVTGVAPVEYVKVFFEQERLPYKEGWRVPAEQTNLLSLALMIIELNAAGGEFIPEALNITANTVGQAFGGYDPITGVLAHLL